VLARLYRVLDAITPLCPSVPPFVYTASPCHCNPCFYFCDCSLNSPATTVPQAACTCRELLLEASTSLLLYINTHPQHFAHGRSLDMDWDEFQRRARKVVPEQELKARRCWIAVLDHRKSTNDSFEEADFIWMIGHSVSFRSARMLYVVMHAKQNWKAARSISRACVHQPTYMILENFDAKDTGNIRRETRIHSRSAQFQRSRSRSKRRYQISLAAG